MFPCRPSAFRSQRSQDRQRLGFTLVEVSIVLVIIGFVIGGVLVGREMIHTSEILNIGHDVTVYKTAVNEFRAKYNGLPGDLNNATEFWGTSSGGCPHGVGTGTCSGNGDGLLTDGGSDEEIHRFWQHLALAGFISGSYTGVSGPGGGVNAVIGVNAPGSRIAGVGFTALNIGVDSPTTPCLFKGDYSRIFQIGRETSYTTENPFLKPAEASLLDIKYDDGLPAFGQYVVRNNLPYNQGGNPDCTDGNQSQAATAKYVLTNDNIACSLLIRNVW